MTSSERLFINNSKITHQTIDGEVVIVNLATGSYYSLDGVGARVWGFFERGATVNEIVKQVGEDFEGKSEEVKTLIEDLVAQLQSEGLVVVRSGAETGKEADGANVPAAAPVTRSQFVPPKLNKYTDMQDLLLLDPIHDVDETGWPNYKPEKPDQDKQK